MWNRCKQPSPVFCLHTCRNTTEKVLIQRFNGICRMERKFIKRLTDNLRDPANLTESALLSLMCLADEAMVQLRWPSIRAATK